VAIVRTDVSEELIAYPIRVTTTRELGTLAVTSNRSMSGRNSIIVLLRSVRVLLTANFVPRKLRLTTVGDPPR
jgi:hypothetical protein